MMHGTAYTSPHRTLHVGFLRGVTTHHIHTQGFQCTRHGRGRQAGGLRGRSRVRAPAKTTPAGPHGVLACSANNSRGQTEACSAIGQLQVPGRVGGRLLMGSWKGSAKSARALGLPGAKAAVGAQHME